MRRAGCSTWLLAGLVLSAALILGLLALAVIGAEVGANGFVAGFLMAAIPVPIYVAFALWIDRFEPEPNWLLALSFVWGASIAVFFSMLLNGFGEAMLASVAGAAAGSTLTAVLSAPLVEELAKGFALFALFGKRDEFDNVTDGIIYAAMIGLGFAMTENVLYYGRAMATNADPAAVFFVRGILGPFSHPLFTSMTGIGLGLARESDRRATKWLAPLAGLAAAMLLHAIWNLAASFGAVFFAAYLFVMFPAFIGVIVVALFSLRRETLIIRRHLERVVADGVLSAEEIEVVTSVRRRIGASARALFRGGPRQWMARRRFHTLATELAFHCWRSSREVCRDADAIRAGLVGEIVNVKGRLG
jgi:RsiW-degrading membrane proteinase PrsW (M82 family)